MGRLLKGALAHKVRLIHTAIAVALAVSLVSGTFAPSGTIDRAFHLAATAFPDGVAVVVRSAAEFDPQAAREAEKSWTDALQFLTTGLLVFAAIALLVSAFIIFNTFSILVAQRTRELGLLRALGASRRQVTASVLVEALAVGLVGAAGGVVAGFVAAKALLAILRSTGFDVPPGAVMFTGDMIVAGLVSGVVVTVAAAIIPARRATEVSPVVGIASIGGEEAAVGSRRRLVAGASTALAGVAALAAGVAESVPSPLLAIAVGAVGVLAGPAMLAPLLAGPVARVMGAPFTRMLGEPARLGRENATRNPRRTAATATALTIGLGLIGVVSIMAASMRASATRTVEDALKADFVVTADGSAGVAPLVAERLRQVDGVQLVSPIKGGQWGYDGRTMTLLAVDPSTVTAMYALDAGSAAALRQLDDKGVLVRDTVAARHKWKVGDQVSMTFARTGAKKLRLQGTFSAPAVRTDYVITTGTYAANYAQQFDLQVSVQLAPDTTPAAGRARIEKALADVPGVKVMDRSQVLADQNDQVQRYLVPVTALLALSVIISLLGIANTLSLSIHERTRELGLLRAIGMGRRQLRSMVKFEAAVISGLGAVLGVVVAVVFGWALVSAMRGQGVTEFVVPAGQLAGWMAVAVAAGLVAAALPAHRAARLDVLEAVGSDR